MNTQRMAAILLAAALGIGSTVAAAYEVQAPIDEATRSNEAKPGDWLPALMDPERDPVLRSQLLGDEIEPNNTPATATTLASGNTVVRAAVFGNADIDYFVFDAPAGARLYASTMTSFSPASVDTTLTLYGPDGTTVIETDADDGSLGGLGSVIAGATLPTGGIYYLEVRGGSATAQVRPYELHLRLHATAPVAEVEPNDTPATATPLPADGWVSGARNPAAAAEQDWYSFTLGAGETAVLALDADPERDGVGWNGRLGIAPFGDANDLVLVVNDGNAGAVAGNPPGEALYMTVNNPGTYYAFVDSADALVGGPTATYQLSVSIRPNVDAGATCTTYTSTNVPAAIGPGSAAVATSTITIPPIPGGGRIIDVDVAVDLTHTVMAEIDATLSSPVGGETGLFTDIGAAATGGQVLMDTVFDDEAAIPPAFTVLRGLRLKPEAAYRLAWFDGEEAAGTWTLTLRDDGDNANGGTLNAWSLRVCTAPPPQPVCAGERLLRPVFDSTFEDGAAGFSVSGTGAQWALGTPATVAGPGLAPFTNCTSGSNCWKTNLTGAYAASTVQDLRSPSISLAGVEAPILVSWAQRYHLENASFDQYFVDALATGGNAQRLREWRDGTMNHSIGLPAVSAPMAAGWSRQFARADGLAGAPMELLFGVRTDSSVNLGGVAIDDVRVEGCVTEGVFADGFESPIQ
jgi:subtilisin-like proprotein convertase family protein